MPHPQMNLRIVASVAARLRQEAQRNHRSLGMECSALLEEALAARDRTRRREKRRSEARSVPEPGFLR